MVKHLQYLLLELWNGVRCDLVDEPAEYDPVLEYVGVVPLGQRLLQHRRDPLNPANIM